MRRVSNSRASSVTHSEASISYPAICSHSSLFLLGHWPPAVAMLLGPQSGHPRPAHTLESDKDATTFVLWKSIFSFFPRRPLSSLVRPLWNPSILAAPQWRCDKTQRSLTSVMRTIQKHRPTTKRAIPRRPRNTPNPAQEDTIPSLTATPRRKSRG